jgi:hypothetical protein
MKSLNVRNSCQTWGLRSSGLLRSVGTHFTVSSGQPVSPIETSVNNYQATLPNIPEERRPQLHRGGSLKSYRTCELEDSIHSDHGPSASLRGYTRIKHNSCSLARGIYDLIDSLYKLAFVFLCFSPVWACEGLVFCLHRGTCQLEDSHYMGMSLKLFQHNTKHL